MKYWLLAALLSPCALLGLWTLFGGLLQRLPLRWTPRLVARRRLKRFVRSGKQVRVVCFGDPAAGEEPGFLFVFDGTLQEKVRLECLTFSDVTPLSAVKRMEEHRGRTAEAYCYCQGRGLQLIGPLEPEASGTRLFVRSLKLSGREGEVFLKTRG